MSGDGQASYRLQLYGVRAVSHTEGKDLYAAILTPLSLGLSHVSLTIRLPVSDEHNGALSARPVTVLSRTYCSPDDPESCGDVSLSTLDVEVANSVNDLLCGAVRVKIEGNAVVLTELDHADLSVGWRDEEGAAEVLSEAKDVVVPVGVAAGRIHDTRRLIQYNRDISDSRARCRERWHSRSCC